MTARTADFRAALRRLPVIAILRHIRPEEVVDVTAVLVGNGVELIEIPFNSPEPLRSIERLVELHGDRCLIGCGTVLTERELRDARAAGAELVLHPHGDAHLVDVAKELEMVSVPGVTSPTEAFAMVAAGADALKFFPTMIVTPSALAAIKEVLPADLLTIAVGGVSVRNMRDYWNVGVDGFGVGTGLYRGGWGAGRVRDESGPLINLARELAGLTRGERP